MRAHNAPSKREDSPASATSPSFPRGTGWSIGGSSYRAAPSRMWRNWQTHWI